MKDIKIIFIIVIGFAFAITAFAGTGEEKTIRELAELVAGVVSYGGEVIWDAGRPDGTPRKLLDVSKLLRLGWAPAIQLEEGVRTTYADYRNACSPSAMNKHGVSGHEPV